MEIQVIRPKKKLFRKLRVCAYCRVSSDEVELENSLENQISHYEEYLKANPEYEMVGIFHDFGISGFKEQRPGFQEMLEAARRKEIDLIITKSVSRFCRNTDTLLKTVRELKELGIGVLFELQDINTLSESGEVMLTVLAAFAQAESDNYRALAQMVYRRKFEAGIPVQHLERCLGYEVNSEGEYMFRVVNVNNENIKRIRAETRKDSARSGKQISSGKVIPTSFSAASGFNMPQMTGWEA